MGRDSRAVKAVIAVVPCVSRYRLGQYQLRPQSYGGSRRSKTLRLRPLETANAPVRRLLAASSSVANSPSLTLGSDEATQQRIKLRRGIDHNPMTSRECMALQFQFSDEIFGRLWQTFGSVDEVFLHG
jgi:hypothetical protein